MKCIARGLVIAFACVVIGGLASACDRDKPARPNEPDETPRAADTPAQTYASRCEACHGKVGRGDGPTAATLLPRPRSFADPAWQSATTDDAIRNVIAGGGPAVGKSQLMPSNPDLAKDPVMMQALVALVRSFGLQAPAATLPLVDAAR